jgi:hypothetical protein
MLARAGLVAAVAGLLTGCGSGLPTIRKDFSESRLRPMPPGAAPLYSWHASEPVLYTFWGKQAVQVTAMVHVPPGWKRPGDEFWSVQGTSAENRPIPFLGVERTYINERGKESPLLYPPLDLQTVPSGLYLRIAPNIALSDGKLVSIKPVAVVFEIRNHLVKPFEVRIPLIPDAESSVTPAPTLHPKPDLPEGTPM